MLASSLIALLYLLANLPLGSAASAEQWRNRSVYQLLTDRFAPTTANAPCNPEDRRYCGGNYRSIIGKLDYIAGMGYDAIWISPTGQNIEGYTQYGEAFHGFWVTDPTKLNPHFGTGDDLKALSKAVHDRGMLLMVDVAINAIASQTTDISDASLAQAEGGSLLFKHQADYHPLCTINWGNHDTEQRCWMATSGVMLMDLNQGNDEVASTLTSWVPGYVKEYGIDGFRLDASKHMTKEWQNRFCTAAGTFCMGEVAGDNTEYAAEYQGADGVDAVFGFGMMNGFIKCFTGSSPSNLQTLSSYIDKAKSYPDQSLIGAFLDNQDLPRINSIESDKTKVYNAIVGTFLYAGIPTIYYGLEQDMSDGYDDPHNREALWLYNNYAQGETYNRIKGLNAIRKALGGDEKWLTAAGSVVGVQTNDIAIKRENTLIVLTNRGSSGAGTWAVDKAGFAANENVVDLLSCTAAKAGSNGGLKITWTVGQPFVFVSAKTAGAARLCNVAKEVSSSISSSVAVSSGTASPSVSDFTSTISATSGSTSTASVSQASSTQSSSSTIVPSPSDSNLIVTDVATTPTSTSVGPFSSHESDVGSGISTGTSNDDDLNSQPDHMAHPSSSTSSSIKGVKPTGTRGGASGAGAKTCKRSRMATRKRH